MPPPGRSSSGSGQRKQRTVGVRDTSQAPPRKPEGVGPGGAASSVASVKAAGKLRTAYRSAHPNPPPSAGGATRTRALATRPAPGVTPTLPKSPKSLHKWHVPSVESSCCYCHARGKVRFPARFPSVQGVFPARTLPARVIPVRGARGLDRTRACAYVRRALCSTATAHVHTT